jgi:hypothetical protein
MKNMVGKAQNTRSKKQKEYTANKNDAGMPTSSSKRRQGDTKEAREIALFEICLVVFF